MTSRIRFVAVVLLVSACRKHSDTNPGWSTFIETDTAVFKGQYPLVGDPSVIEDGSTLRMYYTGFDAYRHPQGPEICEATSGAGG